MTPRWCVLYLAMMLMASGCAAPSAPVVNTDATVTRHSKQGRQALAEGDLDAAVDQYRAALLRAWAIDDPYESGTAAYNLAACFASIGATPQAKQWLLDARVELCRAGSSAGNVWLLEAKVAMDECRFADASRYLNRAECSSPPCQRDDGGCLCGPSDPCQPTCTSKIPCVGSKLADKQAAKACQQEFQAQIQLSRAAIAAEQYDAPSARRHFACACRLAADICSHDLQAQLQHVAALIHLVEGQFMQAAWHFDNEAKHLRLGGNYREIPTALGHAAAAYQEAARFDLAASRTCRVARIWLGRGDSRQAWQQLQIAGELVAQTHCPAAEVRLALVACEIERTLAATGETAQQMIESETVLPAWQSQLQPVDGALRPAADVGTRTTAAAVPVAPVFVDVQFR